MSKCDYNGLYDSQDWCQGRPILPGIKQRVYFIPKRDIVKFPKLPEKPATSAAQVTYEGSFTLAADAHWKHIDLLVSKSPVSSEQQGNAGSVTSLNKATLLHPGIEEAATAFAMNANNDDLVYLVQTKNGKWRVLGNDMYQTSTKVAQNLGADVTDEVGTTIEVEVTDICPAPFYTGEITTEDGVINGKPGEEV